MELFQHHVFVCDQQKPEGVPCCAARDAAAVIDALRAEVARQGLTDRVQVTACGSLGLCEHGPNMVVYPSPRGSASLPHASTRNSTRLPGSLASASRHNDSIR